MSDETTLLQSLSKLKKAGKLRYWRGTIEIPESELHAICDEIQAEHDQAIAATLGDGEYESKMDALLSRLTNGKWSKSRAYDLDFMASCVDEEFEALYARELADAMLGSGTCNPVETEVVTYYDEYGHDAVKVHVMECDRCGGTYEHVNGDYGRCPRCGRTVKP